jgi:predicted dehydrogenase
MFLGPAPKRPFSLERFFRWRCFWDYSGGISTDLFVHLMTTIHYVMDATVPDTVVATAANYRHQQTHEVPDTLNGSAVYGKESFAVSLSGTFNSASAGESGFEILGNEGSLVFRGDRLVFTPEHIVEGNDWIVSSWPTELEKSYRADPEVKRREMPETWTPQMWSMAESWREVGRDATFAHMAHFFESVRTRKASVEDGRRGHHAAAVAHMVNESIRRKAPVTWDFERDVLKV